MRLLPVFGAASERLQGGPEGLRAPLESCAMSPRSFRLLQVRWRSLECLKGHPVWPTGHSRYGIFESAQVYHKDG